MAIFNRGLIGNQFTVASSATQWQGLETGQDYGSLVTTGLTAGVPPRQADNNNNETQ